MIKAYHLSALIALSLSTTLGAWGQRSSFNQSDAQSAESIDIHFPLSPSQAWGMEESLLVWKTFEDDTDYAVRLFQQRPTDSLRFSKVSVKHPEFEWGTGVRLKLTRYLPSNDPWDINLIGTYYYSEASEHAKVSSTFSKNDVNILLSPWDTTEFGNINKANVGTHMNFFTFDLNAGRYYSLTRKIDIHPFIGIRAVLNYQKYKVRYLGFALSDNEGPLVHTHFKGDHDFWGIGPRVGTDVALRMGRHWFLTGTFGASLFGGRYNVSERTSGNVLFVEATKQLRNKLKDEDTVLRSNIDASVGLEWEKWVRGNTVRIAPSFVFEVSEWFSMKRWIDTHFFRNSFVLNTQPALYPHRRYSDLGLMGFNINLKVDF